MEELETGYYWCKSKEFNNEPYILWYDSLRKYFYEGVRKYDPDEISVISPRIQEP